MPESYPFSWVACDCYVWPIALVGNVGRCGWCGVAPHTLVSEPIDGKAGPL